MKMERTVSTVGSEEQADNQERIEAALERVPYIAETRSTYFRQAGYTGPEDVAHAEPAELVSEVYNCGPTTAERVIEGARKVLREDEPGQCDSLPEAELTEAEIADAHEAHATSEPQAVTDLKGEARDQARDIEQSGVPLSAVEDLDGSTLDVGDSTGDEGPRSIACRECSELIPLTGSFRFVDGEAICDSCYEDDQTPDVSPEEFQRRLTTREGGTEFWYRDPETEALITPYNAPGFERWCEARGHDPEDFQSDYSADKHVDTSWKDDL